MKSKIILLATAILTVLFVGCGMQPKTPQETKAPKITSNTITPKVVNPKVVTPKVITTTSRVSTANEFEKAISRNGTQIIAIKNNLTINKDLVFDGEFRNNKAILERELALYSADKDKNITTRFTLTVPKLTINSTQTIMEHGTFKGDLYVSSNNFQLIDTTVVGNVYFTTDEAKSTFKMDNTSKVTGKQELRK